MLSTYGPSCDTHPLGIKSRGKNTIFVLYRSVACVKASHQKIVESRYEAVQCQSHGKLELLPVPCPVMLHIESLTGDIALQLHAMRKREVVNAIHHRGQPVSRYGPTRASKMPPLSLPDLNVLLQT